MFGSVVLTGAVLLQFPLFPGLGGLPRGLLRQGPEVVFRLPLPQAGPRARIGVLGVDSSGIPGDGVGPTFSAGYHLSGPGVCDELAGV